MPNLFLDTNIILLDVNNMYTIAAQYPDYNICLSDTVVEELDSKKSFQGELGYYSREFGRILANSTRIEPIFPSDDTMHVSSYDLGTMTLTIVASLLGYSDVATSTSLINDDRIISAAEYFNGTLMSNDVMCRIRAELRGVQAIDFKYVDNVDFNFTKTIELYRDSFNMLHHTPITSLDPDYEPSNYSYMFVNEETGETKLATINNGLVKVIGKDTERDLRNQAVNPANHEQLLLASLVQDPTVAITICEAIAGSGKTLTSISNAMKLIDNHDKYDSLVYIRNTVNDAGNPDEEVGFLKGSLEDKTSELVAPFYDSINTIAKSIYKSPLKGKALHDAIDAKVDELITKYNMIPRTAYGLRGRTIDNSVIVIDEAQNISKATMQKILSRIGKHCKVIVIGSFRQIDSKHLTKYTSGLSVLMNATNRTDLPVKINAVTLSRVVRGPITELAETLFSKE